MTPTVSIVIGLYNKRPYIAGAVESVLSQSITDLELIVVDDGSTDGGPAELEAYRADSRLRVICQANGGNGAARNRGMRESCAPLIAFLDADDAFLPGHIEALLSLAEQYPSAALLATGFYTVSGSGSRVPRTIPGEGSCLLKDYFAAACRHGYFLTPSGCAVRRTAVAEVGGFLEGVPIGEDLEYWARIALRFPVAYDSRPSTLYYVGVPGGAMSGFRWHPGSPAVVEMLSRWINDAKAGAKAQSIIDYAAWILLNHAASGISALHRRQAREVLLHPLIAQSSFLFRRACLWLAATWVPEFPLGAYLNFREWWVARARRRTARDCFGPVRETRWQQSQLL